MQRLLDAPPLFNSLADGLFQVLALPFYHVQRPLDKSKSHKLTPFAIAESIDHTPRLHPQDPQAFLPKSFAEYRIRASQHGPLTGYKVASSSTAIPSKPRVGEYVDRNELPKRFWRLRLSKPEMQAIEDGAALI